jgi:hypothetical protein
MRLKTAALALSPLTVALYIAHAKPAKADDWPCEAILCLSNPGGPTQYGACEPPMTEWFQCLGNPTCVIPTCPGINTDFKTENDSEICPIGSAQKIVYGGKEGQTPETECTYTAKPSGNVYQVSPYNFQYNILFTATYSGGSMSYYVNTGTDKTLNSSQIPALSAAQIAYWNSLPRNHPQGGGRV